MSISFRQVINDHAVEVDRIREPKKSPKLTKPTEPVYRLLTAEEAAEYLDVRIQMIHKLVRQGRLQCVQISPKIRKFSLDQLKAFTHARKTPMPQKNIDKELSNESISAKGSKEPCHLDQTPARKELRKWLS